MMQLSLSRTRKSISYRLAGFPLNLIQRPIELEVDTPFEDLVLKEVLVDRGAIKSGDRRARPVTVNYLPRCGRSILGPSPRDNVIWTFVKFALHVAPIARVRKS